MSHLTRERLMVNMSSVVIEFEGFQVNTNDFVVKELAFYSVDFGYHGLWSFLPPHSWEQLSPKERKTFAWLTRNLHGLRWDSGDLPFSYLEPILSSLFISYETIYSKGLEKVKFLEYLSGQKIFNLDDFNCPKISFFHTSTVKCPNHKTHFKHCALTKAFTYGEYIKERKKFAQAIRAQDVDHRTSETAEQDETESSFS